MGYNPTPDDQWTHDDLARATEAHDYKAIGDARRSGQLNDVMATPAPAPDPAETVGPAALDVLRRAAARGDADAAATLGRLTDPRPTTH